MVRFQIQIDEKTYKALRSLSQNEYRDWRLQAGLLIREELERRGLLASPLTLEQATTAGNLIAQGQAGNEHP